MLCAAAFMCGTNAWVEAAGYLASFLIFGTFCMKTMIPLRVAGISSNIALSCTRPMTDFIQFSSFTQSCYLLMLPCRCFD